MLVVEDDEEVRETAVDMLSDLGYRVLKAKDAQSALAIVESGVPIDLLFTDVVMPGPLRSPELARKTQERWPGVAVLYTSGYTENAIVHGGRLDEGVELVSKPYTREALARKIRHVLRNQRQRGLARSPTSQAAPPQASGDVASATPRRLNVLLIEDEAIIRLSTSDMLSSLGHSVAEAANGKQALEMLDKDAYDVIVADLALPDMGGDDLAADAVKRQPDLRVIFATGYQALPKNERLEGLRTVILNKPYRERDIAEALKAAMSSLELGRKNPRAGWPRSRRAVSRRRDRRGSAAFAARRPPAPLKRSLQLLRICLLTALAVVYQKPAETTLETRFCSVHMTARRCQWPERQCRRN